MLPFWLWIVVEIEFLFFFPFLLFMWCEQTQSSYYSTKPFSLCSFRVFVFFFRKKHFSLFFFYFYSSSPLRLFSSSLPFQWISRFISFIFLIRRSIFWFCSNNFRSVVLAFGHWKKFSLNIYISTRVPNGKYRR